MLTRLQLTDYQSHKKTDLRLGPFTVIVGPSSSGKTSVVRALRLIAQNARGTSYVRHGAKSARVRVSSAQFQGDPSDAQIHVAIERGKSVSAYELTLAGPDTTQVYTKCGTTVPEIILSALDFGEDELWLAGQFDRPFLLDDTGSQVARVLGELTNVTMIYASVRELNRRAGAAKQNQVVLSTELEQVKFRIMEYVNLPGQLAACGSAEAAVARAEALSVRRINLFGCLLAVGGARDRVAASRAVLRSVPDVTRLTRLMEARSRLAVLVDGVAETLARRDSVVLRSVPAVGSLVALAGQWVGLGRALEEVNRVRTQLVESRAVAIRVAEECARVRVQLGTVLVEAGECPVCGADAVHAHLERVGH